MSQPIRIRVKLHKKNEELRLAQFTECILKYFNLSGASEGIGNVHVSLTNNHLQISDDKFTGSEKVMIKHPSFCPMLHLTSPMASELPAEIASRGVDVGAAVLIESCDGLVLLTRRARHLKIFPGLWVPPGGHVEADETLLQAGLRELEEETGLTLATQDCIGGKINLLALWESVFPPKLSVGPPKRHHIVVYFHAQLVNGLNSSLLEKRVKFDPGEVDACAWFDRKLITAVAQSDDDGRNVAPSTEGIPSSIRALVLDENNKQCDGDLPTAPFLRIHSDSEDDKERVSTGTKFALQQFLNLKKVSSL